MAQTTAGASHGLTQRRNGGVVFYGGNIPSGGPITVAPSLETAGYRSGFSGTKPIESSDVGSYQPNSSGPFAYKMEAGKFIGMRMPGYLSGVANTTLETGAGDFGHRHPIHRLEKERRLGAWSDTSWDYVTGAITKGTGYGDSYDFKNIRGSGHVDDAAWPTRSVPGELVYNEGKGKDQAATQADYDEKNG